MRITSVEYRRLRSFGNFENETVGATALVEAGFSANDVLDDLRVWVEERLSLRNSKLQVESELDAARRALASLQEDIKRAGEQWDKARAFLERHGVNLPEEFPF